MKIYEYDKTDIYDFKLTHDKDFNINDSGEPENILKLDISFPSPFTSGIQKNDKVSCSLFIDKNNLDDNNICLQNITNSLKSKTDLIILIHGFSTNKKKLSNYYKFIKKTVSKNNSCLFINLPFHLERTPSNEISGKQLTYYDDKDTLLFFHQCVVDLRKAIDIMEELINPSSIKVCGISLGCMVSVILMAVEKRISKGALLLGGGYWEDIHWRGIMRFLLKGNCADTGKINRNKCHEYYSNYLSFLQDFKTIKHDNISIDLNDYSHNTNLCTKKCYLCDPLTFAHLIDPNNVIMINSKIDHFFTRKSSVLLWKELGKPRIYWFLYPHLSSIINNKKVYKLIMDFLN